MKLTITNESGKVRVSVKPSNTIATVKAAYVKAAALVGDAAGYIALFHAARPLEDAKTLRDYGIADGATIEHIRVRQRSYSDQDYQDLSEYYEAKQLAKRGGAADPADYPEHWDTTWTHGEDWKTYPTVITSNIWSGDADGAAGPAGAGAAGAGAGAGAGADAAPSTSEAITARGPDVVITSPVGRTKLPLPRRDMGTSGAREFQSLYVCKARHHTFRVIHRMEGRWNGEADYFPAVDGQARVCAVDFSFDRHKAVWRERQSLTTQDGLSTSTTVVWTPVSDGVCLGIAEESSFRHLAFRMEEEASNIVLIIATSKRTGKTVFVETTTVIDDLRRVRTVQRFSEKGNFQSVITMREQRVIDAVSGAVERAARA